MSHSLFDDDRFEPWKPGQSGKGLLCNPGSADEQLIIFRADETGGGPFIREAMDALGLDVRLLGFQEEEPSPEVFVIRIPASEPEEANIHYTLDRVRGDEAAAIREAIARLNPALSWTEEEWKFEG